MCVGVGVSEVVCGEGGMESHRCEAGEAEEAKRAGRGGVRGGSAARTGRRSRLGFDGSRESRTTAGSDATTSPGISPTTCQSQSRKGRGHAGSTVTREKCARTLRMDAKARCRRSRGARQGIDGGKKGDERRRRKGRRSAANACLRRRPGRRARQRRACTADRDCNKREEKERGRNQGDVRSDPDHAIPRSACRTIQIDIPERCIKARTRLAEKKLDPFSGSGTTGEVGQWPVGSTSA